MNAGFKTGKEDNGHLVSEIRKEVHYEDNDRIMDARFYVYVI